MLAGRRSTRASRILRDAQARNGAAICGNSRRRDFSPLPQIEKDRHDCWIKCRSRAGANVVERLVRRPGGAVRAL